MHQKILSGILLGNASETILGNQSMDQSRNQSEDQSENQSENVSENILTNHIKKSTTNNITTYINHPTKNHITSPSLPLFPLPLNHNLIKIPTCPQYPKGLFDDPFVAGGVQDNAAILEAVFQNVF